LHGNKPVKINESNIILIDKMELIINEILVKFIVLSEKHTFKEINDAIKKSLYLKENIEKILIDKKNAP
jgi:hypothetical protein